MFNVICSRVCVGRGIGTISKMLYICYHQGSIVLAVCAYFQISLHRVLISFIRVLYYAVVVWFLLGQLKSCIISKLVVLSIYDC